MSNLEKRALRAGSFVHNNGKVLRTVNILRLKYNKLTGVQSVLEDDGIAEDEFLDSVNFLTEEGYIHLRRISNKEPAALADTDYTALEAKLTGKGIRLLAGGIEEGMGKKAGNRKHSKIDALDPALRETVEQMLLSGSTYSEIVDFLGENGVGISVASVCRYAKAYQAEVQMLNMAQENFRRMMDELDKYPDLDTTEAIIRLTSQNLLNALANTSEEDWQGVSIDKMLREANALVRAAAYKKRVEIQNQDTTEAGLEAVKSLVWQAMAKERPDLYRQVNEFLNSKKQEGLEAR